MSQTPAALPTRPLGRTGQDVSILSLGGVKYNERSDRHAVGVVNRAIDLGINYIDTAHSYSDSERKIGLAVRDRRDDVFLATKSTQRGRDGMRREIEQAFSRLQTDRLDLVQIHDLANEDQLAEVLGPDGAVRAIEEYRDAGQVRFVGVTGHRYPDVLARALKEYAFDTILVALGAMQAAVRPFYPTVMPVAQERGVGVVAMKVMAHGWFGRVGLAQSALRFVLGRPGVATALVGVDDTKQLEQNVKVARGFSALSDPEQNELLERVRRLYREQPGKAWFIYR